MRGCTSLRRCAAFTTLKPFKNSIFIRSNVVNESLPSRRAVIKNPPDSIFESRYIPTIAVRTMALSLNWCSRVGRQRMTHQFATLRIHHAFRYLLHDSFKRKIALYSFDLLFHSFDIRIWHLARGAKSKLTCIGRAMLVVRRRAVIVVVLVPRGNRRNAGFDSSILARVSK